MNLRPIIVAGVFAISTVAYAQTTTTETKTVTVTGEVVRYVPGQTIVVKGPDQKVTTYTLSSQSSVPTDVQVGRTVSIVTDPSPGSTVVRKVTTTTVTPEGRTQRTEETRTNSSTTTTTMTTSSGKVTAYETGKTVTVTKPDGTQITYVLSPQTQVPMDLTVGKAVTVQVEPGPATSTPRATTIIYSR